MDIDYCVTNDDIKMCESAQTIILDTKTVDNRLYDLLKAVHFILLPVLSFRKKHSKYGFYCLFIYVLNKMRRNCPFNKNLI